jgi:DNA-binding GntR family transcriptional regulator
MYPPRYQLIEESLVKEFGVSRSPIRQALTHLAAEGLVEQLPRRGFRVRQLKLRDVEELYEFRLALETQIVYELAHKGFPEEELIRLQTAWQDPASLVGRSVAELAAMDEDFHATLAIVHNNKLIHQHLLAINERLFAFREIDFEQQARLESTCDQHCRILHAIVSRNPNQARDQLRHNINSGLGNVERVIVQLVARSFLNNSVQAGGQ